MRLAEKDMRDVIQLTENALEGVFATVIAENMDVVHPVRVVQLQSIGIGSTNPAAERLFPTPGRIRRRPVPSSGEETDRAIGIYQIVSTKGV